MHRALTATLPSGISIDRIAGSISLAAPGSAPVTKSAVIQHQSLVAGDGRIHVAHNSPTASFLAERKRWTGCDTRSQPPRSV